jgi:hypothetical protein
VAGLEENGNLIRLYPVPFRLIADTAKFKKWQWITAQIQKTNRDRRPESHRIGVDTIVCDDEIVSTRNNWQERRQSLDKLPVFDRMTDLESDRLKSGTTLGLLRPARILGLDIAEASSEWTDEERSKLLAMQQQGNLFDNTDASSIALLRKLPFDFHYRYTCVAPDGTETEHKHKIADWEIGALYWNVARRHDAQWEEPLRNKLERELPSRDLMFLMGTIHRFPDQWLITSLIYPPKQQPLPEDQLPLL